MADLVLITGGGSGLGRALSLEFARRGFDVLIAGRRRQKLEETRVLSAGRAEIVEADLSEVAGRQAVIDAVGDRPLRFLVHNAGTIAPIGPLAKVDLQAWRYAMALNVEAPVFLTQALLPRLHGGRILHISSGAARNASAGWGVYCISKAGLLMAYQVLREELSGTGVLIGSLRPGVVDTPMQAYIREQDEAVFPSVRRFRRLKEENQLRTPEEVASFAAWILCHTDAHEFTDHEWEIANPEHTLRWRYA